LDKLIKCGEHTWRDGYFKRNILALKEDLNILIAKYVADKNAHQVG
jgi:hypothetical protein